MSLEFRRERAGLELQNKESSEYRCLLEASRVHGIGWCRLWREKGPGDSQKKNPEGRLRSVQRNRRKLGEFDIREVEEKAAF